MFDVRKISRFKDGMLVSDYCEILNNIPSAIQTGIEIKNIFGKECNDTCRMGCSRCPKEGCLPNINIFVELMRCGKDPLYIDLKGNRCNCTLVIDRHD